MKEQTSLGKYISDKPEVSPIVEGDKTMSLLIIGYDGYSDLWNDCVGLLNKFWPDCPYQIFFVNNSLDVIFDNVKVYHAGENAEWSQKVQLGLSVCKTEYVCLLLEDFLCGDYVKNESVENLLSLMKKKEIDYVKLVDMNSVLKPHNKHINENRKIQYIRYCDDYGISLQPSIWKRSFLEQKVGLENYNAWQFEFNRVKETDPKNRGYLSNALFDTRNILNIKHGVIQGQYLPDTIKFFRSKGIELNVNRDVMSKKDYRKIRTISLFKSLIPIGLRPFVKNRLEKRGMKFVSTTRGDKK